MGSTKRKPATILRAVLEELASADYGGLTYERVAARAGVNKTTLYRQWPTKDRLVRAALESVTEVAKFGPSTGSLRNDLLRLGRMTLDFYTSFEGQGLIRLGLLHHPEPELAKIARALNERHMAELVTVLREAVDRGELSADTDPLLLIELLGGALHVRLFIKKERVDDVIIANMVDVILNGAALTSPSAKPGRPPKKSTSPQRRPAQSRKPR